MGNAEDPAIYSPARPPTLPRSRLRRYACGGLQSRKTCVDGPTIAIMSLSDGPDCSRLESRRWGGLSDKMPDSGTWSTRCGGRGKGKTIDRYHLHLDIRSLGRGGGRCRRPHSNLRLSPTGDSAPLTHSQTRVDLSPWGDSLASTAVAVLPAQESNCTKRSPWTMIRAMSNRVLSLMMIASLLVCPLNCLAHSTQGHQSTPTAKSGCKCCHHPTQHDEIPFESDSDSSDCICHGAILTERGNVSDLEAAAFALLPVDLSQRFLPAATSTSDAEWNVDFGPPKSGRVLRLSLRSLQV